MCSSAKRQTLEHPFSLDIWYFCSMIFFAFGSLLLLILIKLVLSTEKFRRGAGGVFIAHLLIVHLIVCSVEGPVALVSVYKSFKGTNDFGINCKWLMFFRLVTFHADIWASFFLALNRATAVVFPLYYRRHCAAIYVSAVVVFSSWVIAIACNIPALFGAGQIFGYFPPWFTCNARPTNNTIATLTNTVAWYLPMASGCGVYGATAVFVYFNRKVRMTKNDVRTLRATAMLSATFVWQAVCFIPIVVAATKYPWVLAVPDVFLWLLAVQMIGYSGNPVCTKTFWEATAHKGRSLFWPSELDHRAESTGSRIYCCACPRTPRGGGQLRASWGEEFSFWAGCAAFTHLKHFPH